MEPFTILPLRRVGTQVPYLPTLCGTHHDQSNTLHSKSLLLHALPRFGNVQSEDFSQVRSPFAFRTCSSKQCAMTIICKARMISDYKHSLSAEPFVFECKALLFSFSYPFANLFRRYSSTSSPNRNPKSTASPCLLFRRNIPRMRPPLHPAPLLSL